jgi:hypothetical protein
VVEVEVAYEEKDRLFRLYDIFDLIKPEACVEDYILLLGLDKNARRIAGSGIIPTVRPEKDDFHR